jgi:hypothetical protein
LHAGCAHFFASVISSPQLVFDARFRVSIEKKLSLPREAPIVRPLIIIDDTNYKEVLFRVVDRSWQTPLRC